MLANRSASNVRLAGFAWLAVAAGLVVLGWGGLARADDTGNFVVTLGRDTTSVEHYSSTPARLEVDQVGRSPRVLRRHFTYDFAGGVMTQFAMVVTPPGSTTPTQTVNGSLERDSLRVTTQSGSAAAQQAALAIPPGTIVVPSSSPWVGYQAAIVQCVAGKQDSLRVSLWFVGAPGPSWMTVHKLQRNQVSLVNERGVYQVEIDKTGRIRAVQPIEGTAQYAVQRVERLDLDALTAAYSARDQAGAGLGVLSPRDTVQVSNATGAALMIDYGRPAKRGRVVFGGVVPFGKIWRTGANAATQFKTDKALDFGGTIVPAGFYTLWTRPTAQGWKLIINGETGQWGTEHKADKDLYSIDMQQSTLPAPVERFTIHVEPTPQGGRLDFDWDTTRASAAFVVRP